MVDMGLKKRIVGKKSTETPLNCSIEENQLTLQFTSKAGNKQHLTSNELLCEGSYCLKQCKLANK